MIAFTQKDEAQLNEKGITKAKVEQQIATFKEGIPFVQLVDAAIVGKGISRFTETEQQDLAGYFEAHAKDLSLLKFVPASGAASRMFKSLFNFLEVYDPNTEPLEAYFQRTQDKDLKKFAEGMEKLPFYEKMLQRLPKKDMDKGQQLYAFVTEMLTEKGLNYGFYPKGLLPFHGYASGAATPFEEHLKEAALYAKTKGRANLHFTISEQHNDLFKEEEAQVVSKISEKTNTTFSISYSNQKSATDTLAVDMDNKLFRDADGSILFRPGGHGALIENLNDQDADIIFIKNIDNVVVDRNLTQVAQSKKVLAGLLLKVQAKVFEHLKELETGEVSKETLGHMQQFLEKDLNVALPDTYESSDTPGKIALLQKILHRPIRICGMVKNEGEPGGGPFFIKDKNGHVSLQIIESAQINMEDGAQVAILKNATHFNPVDLVCAMKDHHGMKYDLQRFVDEKQGFITEKTKAGMELKALELPGLWNGAMAHWSTLFVEVPLVTFNPVKTVNDLLKPSHQA